MKSTAEEEGEALLHLLPPQNHNLLGETKKLGVAIRSSSSSSAMTLLLC